MPGHPLGDDARAWMQHLRSMSLFRDDDAIVGAASSSASPPDRPALRERLALVEQRVIRLRWLVDMAMARGDYELAATWEEQALLAEERAGHARLLLEPPEAAHQRRPLPRPFRSRPAHTNPLSRAVAHPRPEREVR